MKEDDTSVQWIAEGIALENCLVCKESLEGHPKGRFLCGIDCGKEFETYPKNYVDSWKREIGFG